MGIRHPGSGEREMGYFSWLVSCRLIWLNLMARLGKEKCVMQRMGKGICPRAVLDCCSGI